MVIFFLRLYSAATVLTGLAAMIYFFPSPHGCSGILDCLPYSFSGLLMIILGVGLFRKKAHYRTGMLWFSFIFISLFIVNTVWLIKTDPTAQGLIGMILLSPMVIICVAGIFILSAATVQSLFDHTR